MYGCVTDSNHISGHVQGQDKKLSDYLGKNDKTKIVCKLQKKGAGAPQREPIVDENTQKEMMSFYHKKQVSCMCVSEREREREREYLFA
jgi:hypothetical protein